MGLKKRDVDALKYSGDASKNEKCILWADEPTGFGIRVYPSGKKAFVLSFRHEGRKQLKTIGRYGDLTIKLAEDQARKDLVDLMGNLNPLELRRKSRLGDTVKQLCDVFINEKSSKKKTGDDDIRRINRHILPAWGSHKAKAITKGDVKVLHTKISKTAPYEANRVLALVSAIYNYAIKEKIFDGDNPAKGANKNDEVSRDRFVTTEEMPGLIAAIDKEPNQAARCALWLYLLTGVRKEELLSARWSDVDLGRKELRLNNTKNGKTHYVPLSEPAMRILEQLPRQEGNPYLIIGSKPGQRLYTTSTAWYRVRKAAGVEDVRIHDLRRSVGSWLAQAGNTLHLIGKVLNHSSSTTTAIYARFGQDHVREALDRHGERLMHAAGLRESGEVIKINSFKKH